MDAWEAVAREAIRELVARYAHCADRGRFAELVALFTDDGTLTVNDLPPAQGAAAIHAFLTAAAARLAAASPTRLVRHHVTSVSIEVTSRASAAAASYFLVLSDVGVDHWGRYRDLLVERDGRWLFQHRQVRTEGHAAGSRLGNG